MQRCLYASDKKCTVSAPKCTRNCLAAGVPPGPAKELTALSQDTQAGFRVGKRGREEGRCRKGGEGGEGKEMKVAPPIMISKSRRLRYDCGELLDGDSN